MTYCACGQPLHYTDRNIRATVDRLIGDNGEEVLVQSGGRRWLVQRHYIALHGLKAATLPTLPFIEIVENDEVIIPYVHDTGSHRRKSNEHDFADQVFEHIDPDDGLVRNFHINKLHKLINDFPGACELDDVEIDPEVIAFLIENHGIELDHVERMMNNPSDTPGILCQFADGSFLTVDGNHRLVARHRLGETTMKFWIVPERIWRKSLLAPIYQR